MAYRSFYWAGRGRGEQVRLLLNELREDYEDIHVDMGEGIRAMEQEGPGTLSFGSVPSRRVARSLTRGLDRPAEA